MYTEIIAAVMATLAALLLAVNVILIRKATVEGNPLDAVLAILLIGTIIFLPVSILTYYPNFQITVTSLLAFALAGIAGPFLGRACYYEATKRVGASRTVAVTRGSLIVSSLIGILVLGEAITAGHGVGIIILLLGVVTVSYHIESRDQETDFESKLSILFLFGTIMFWGIPAPLVKVGLSTGISVMMGLAIEFTVGLVALYSYYKVRGYSPIRFIHKGQNHLYLWAGILYSAGIGILNSALSISRVVVVIPFRSLTPLFTLILSYFFLKRLENITMVVIIGSVLAVLGSILIGVSM